MRRRTIIIVSILIVLICAGFAINKGYNYMLDKAAEALLKCSANPDIARKNGETLLFLAAEFSWIDNAAKKDSKYMYKNRDYIKNNIMKY